jgi:hypothetical protein
LFPKKRRSEDGPRPPSWLDEILDEERLSRLETASGVRLLRYPSDPDKLAFPYKCGSYGCVFLLEGDEDRVMKITEDESEGPYTNYVRLLQQEGVRTKFGSVRSVTVRVDGIWRIFYDEELVVYAILEERVGKLPSSISENIIDGSDTYTDGWDLIVKAAEMKSDKRAEKAYAEGELLIQTGLRQMEKGGPRGRAVAEFLRLVHEESVPLTDVHRSNLCIRLKDGPTDDEKKGQIVVIDFGVSQAKSPFRKSIVKLRRKA